MKIVKYIVILTLSVVLSLFTLGLLNPTIQVQDKLEIASDPPQVFAVLFDPGAIQKWFPQVVDIKHLEGMPFMEGSKEVCIIKVGNKNQEFITELVNFEPYKNVTLGIENDKFSGTLEVNFFENGKNTTVSYTNTLKPKNIFYRALFALTESMIEKRFHQTFEQFKLVAEA